MRRHYCMALVAWFLVLVSSSGAWAASEPELDPDEVKAAKELFEVIRMAETYARSMDMMVEQQVAMSPQIAPFRKTMKAFFNKHMGWGSMESEMIALYCKHFTAQEIREITAFNRTPTGRKSARLIPELSTQGMAIAQRKIQANMGELQAMIEADMARLKAEKEGQPQPQP